jgi:L-ascorbate metabolism protein UlaG (beta-lactamase superfamily)
MKFSRLFQALTVAGLALAVTSPARAADAKEAKEAKDAKAPSPYAAAATTATFWGHAAWIITTPGGATIAIDPWLDNPLAPKLEKPTKLDAILLTHGHFDHVGGVVELAKKTGAKIVATLELTQLLGVSDAIGAEIGGTITIKDVTIHVVEALHSSGYVVGKKPEYAGAPVGYVLDVAKGPVIYHAGDTDVFAGMSLIADRYHPTVALLPIGGHFTMDPTGAALATKMLKVKTVIPMHYGTFPTLKGTPDELRAALKKLKVPAKVVEVKPGDSTNL